MVIPQANHVISKRSSYLCLGAWIWTGWTRACCIYIRVAFSYIISISNPSNPLQGSLKSWICPWFLLSNFFLESFGKMCRGGNLFFCASLSSYEMTVKQHGRSIGQTACVWFCIKSVWFRCLSSSLLVHSDLRRGSPKQICFSQAGWCCFLEQSGAALSMTNCAGHQVPKN